MPLGSLLLIAVLATAPDVDGLRHELDEVAQRIEQLKARALAGEAVESELEPLLVRSQELAAELERARPEPAPPPPAVADADRERADELRTEAAVMRGQAARLADGLAGVEARIAAALRAATTAGHPASQDGVARAMLTSTVPADEVSRSRTELTALVRERAQLERSIAALRHEAMRLEAQANALDAE